MNLSLSPEDTLFADGVLRRLRTDRSSDASVQWHEFAELGWLSLPVAEEHGGAGASDATLAVLVEQLGFNCSSEPYLPVVVMAAGLLGRIGGPDCETMLSHVVSGEALPVCGEQPRLQASLSGGNWTLQGAQPLVLGADRATQFLLPAYTDGVLNLFCVARGEASVTEIRTLGPCHAADLSLDSAPARLLSRHDVTEMLAWMQDRSAAMACADAIGAMRYLVQATIEFTNARVQFNKPLAQFQVIEHFRAELLTWLEEARAITQLAIAAIDAEPAHRNRAVSAAKVKVGKAARAIAHQSIQMHGAMGVTNELDVGLYAKRLLAFDALWGSRDSHLNRYAMLSRTAGVAGTYLAQETPGNSPVHLSMDQTTLDFREAVRAFLNTHLAGHLRFAQQLTTTVYPEPDIAGQWHRILQAHGWSAPNWPQQHGGTGWSAEQRYVWAHENAAAGAPIISPIGLQLVGPVLMQFGSAAQKSRHLPAILSGEELWCQGFSEPGAGSDLAALSTRAVRDGDDYVVNGSKIWTTHGHFAHHMAALVRTGPGGGRREGISFLLIAMNAPGVNIRPILTIGGDHELNQIFLDDVRVPAANLVGAEGQGWAIAKYMLEYERGGDIMSGGLRQLMAQLRQVALTREIEDAHSFWRAYAEAGIDIDTLEMLELRALLGSDDASPATASILKLRASEIQQAVTELGIRLLGRDAIRWEHRRPLYEVPGAGSEQALVSRYLNSRANTIFGGTREIQKTLIARAAPTH